MTDEVSPRALSREPDRGGEGLPMARASRVGLINAMPSRVISVALLLGAIAPASCTDSDGVAPTTAGGGPTSTTGGEQGPPAFQAAPHPAAPQVVHRGEIGR